MKKYLIVFAVLPAVFVAQGAHASPPPCVGISTSDVERCLELKLKHAESELERYTAAAIKRIGQGDDPDQALESFHTSQDNWSAYRNAECGAVYDFWSTGTIRGVKSLTCDRRVTETRIHEIWFNFLTYVDSTPPILPEPAVELGR